MGCAVQACKGPITVDQADDECDAVLGPSRRVDKGSKDELGGFMSRRFGGDGDENHGERDERDVEGAGGEGGKEATVTIEEEGEKVD
jgi:hypothetical protein